MITNDGKLDELEAGSGRLRDMVALTHQAFDFDASSSKLKNRYKWQKIKMMVLMGAAGIFFLVILYLIIS